MSDLKPCKKCGSIPRVKYRIPRSQVICQCGRHSRTFYDWYEQEDGKQDAIEDWNDNQEALTCSK